MTERELLDGVSVLPPISPRPSGYYVGKKVLVTGACGSIGSALFRELKKESADVRGVDWDEYQVSKQPDIHLQDYRDIHTLDGEEIVFHCAAYKHVSLGSRNWVSFFANNSDGVRDFTRNLRDDKNLKAFVYLSTDKVAGRSVLGESKLAGEDHVLRELPDKGRVLRLVNCAFSRGSVLDKWANGQKTVCEPDCIRYFMQVQDAVQTLLWMPILRTGKFTVWDVPQFSIHKLATEFGGVFDPIKLSDEEAQTEKLICVGEGLESTELSWVKRIL